jgi:hypothetical protein
MDKELNAKDSQFIADCDALLGAITHLVQGQDGQVIACVIARLHIITMKHAGVSKDDFLKAASFLWDIIKLKNSVDPSP